MQGKLNEIRTLISKDGGESKRKSLYMTGCALILHYFSLERIPTSRTDLISVVNPCSSGMRCHSRGP